MTVLAASDRPPVTDSTALAAAVLFMFKRFTFASGELEMPCDLACLDQHMQLIEDVLQAFYQRPPLEELQTWRQIVAAKIAEGQASDVPTRLLLKYEAYDPFVGLTGGFQLSITLTEQTEIDFANKKIDHHSAVQFEQLTTAKGEILMPCVPSLIEQHIRQLERVLRSLRQELSDIELNTWRQAIAPNVTTWFDDSPNSYLVVQYELIDPSLGLQSGIKLNVFPKIKSIEDHYQHWADTREGPLFGSHPDAKVMAIATQLGTPADTPILDVGAGTGRNTLALARQGYRVDALELTYVLIEQLYTTARTEGLAIRLIQADILNPQLVLKPTYYRLVFLSEVIASHFRSPAQVRQLMVLMSEAIAPGGFLLFNLFLTVDDYEPNDIVRELSQFCWSYIMTRQELQDCLADLPLEIISDESVFDYERLHLPPEAFPPTAWFTNWATGRNLFPIQEAPPAELRWIVCRREQESEG